MKDETNGKAQRKKKKTKMMMEDRGDEDRSGGVGYSDLQSVIVTFRLGLDIIFGLYKFITNDSILLLYLCHT